MARARNIKPGFFKNEQLADLAPITRLFFIGLWTIADRDGRLENRPKRIKAEVFPYDDVDVAKCLSELRDMGFLDMYQAGDIHCIQIANWEKHQHPHRKESESTIPAPEKPVLVPEKPVPVCPKPLILNPQPETLNPHSAEAEVGVSLTPVDNAANDTLRAWNYYVKVFQRSAAYEYTPKRKAKGMARYQDCLRMAKGDRDAACQLMKKAIDALAASSFHRDGGFIDWEKHLFNSTEKLQQWLDKKGEQNGTRQTDGRSNPAQQRQDESNSAIVQAVRNRLGEANGLNESSVPEPEHHVGNSNGVPSGLGEAGEPVGSGRVQGDSRRGPTLVEVLPPDRGLA
jgi:hypothetical protein